MESNEGRLAGKVALITGGASGIGRACAERYAEEGAEVVIADRDAKRGAEVAAGLQASSNRRAVFVEVDVADESSVDDMVARTVQEFGRVDTVLAAAGISNSQYESGVVQDRDADLESRLLINQSVADWDRVIAVNLTGVMLTDRSAARAMIESGGGTIVNIASTAARVPLPGAADYNVSKAGVAMLTNVLAAELVSYGIRVNAIGPGFVETPMTQAMQDDDESHAMMLGMTPMGRLGTPLEMANTALFLACGESSYMTGQTLYPNGGMYAG